MFALVDLALVLSEIIKASTPSNFNFLTRSIGNTVHLGRLERSEDQLLTDLVASVPTQRCNNSQTLYMRLSSQCNE